MNDQPTTGSVGWHGLTVPDAERLRDLYAAVIGWHPAAVDMGGYAVCTNNGDAVRVGSRAHWWTVLRG